jgi:hypothetical protein
MFPLPRILYLASATPLLVCQTQKTLPKKCITASSSQLFVNHINALLKQNNGIAMIAWVNTRYRAVPNRLNSTQALKALPVENNIT